MCGIAGLLAPEISSEHAENTVATMIAALVHRGPDDGGLWRSQNENLVLGHRRLSIQDLSVSGQQPMMSLSKRYTVVFNGEIYNFKEIAATLVKCGYHFYGHSDTEVLLAAIEKWGLEAAVTRFVGMFAFALWDGEKKVLHLCRDRLGEKPLYYGWVAGSFYFSSELKAIESVVSRDQLTTEFAGLSCFLQYGYVSAPYSIYQSIYKLMPGTILSIPVTKRADTLDFSPFADRTTVSPKTYWSILTAANHGLSDLIQSEQEVVEALDQAIHKSVRRQMIADVELGTFLSGGIDSTVVSAIAQSESSERIKTYTIGFSEKEYDESLYAERIAGHLGTDHLTMQVTPADILNVVPGIASIYDEPFADSSQMPSYLVSKLAKEHVTVCLSGDGGDELFAGYNRYLWTQSLWNRMSMIPLPVKQLAGKALAQPSPAFWDGLYGIIAGLKSNKQEKQKLVGLKVQKLAGFFQQNDIYAAYDYLMSYWHEPAAILEPHTSNNTSLKYPFPDTESFINQAMYMDQLGYLPGDNLAKVDRASMAVSLETRLPLLSHELVELAWRIPVAMKVKNNVSKWALREVLYKYVPREMIERPKMGFSVPVAQWLRSDLKDWAGDLLSGLDSVGSVLQKKEITRVWQEHVSGQYDHSHRLWSVLMYLSWSENRPE